jgi:hypothetical protein
MICPFVRHGWGQENVFETNSCTQDGLGAKVLVYELQVPRQDLGKCQQRLACLASVLFSPFMVQYYGNRGKEVPGNVDFEPIHAQDLGT